MQLRRAFSAIIVIGGLVAPVSEPTCAQTREPSSDPAFRASNSYSEQELEAQVPEARPEDVSSPQAIVKALHDSISGPKGAWNPDRLRSLCVPGVYFVYGDKGQDRVLRVSTISLDDTIKGFTRLHMQSDWYESVDRMRVTQAVKKDGYRVVTVSYSGREGTQRVTGSRPNPSRGATTDLIYIGRRWWIVSHMW
jgi:hypothetical protein